MRKKLLSGLALTGVVGLLLMFASPTYRQAEPGVAGKPAPEFSFELDGKPARLADLRGKVVVLNFWATWCPPCVDEMPSLNRLHQQIAGEGGLVLGVSVDEDPSAYARFLQDYKIPSPTHRDPSKRIALEYGTVRYPETYVLDRRGRFARKIIGPQNWDSPELTGYIRDLLARGD